MAYTYAQQLDFVQAAIRALETGNVAEYSVDGITYRYHDLKTLYDREERLMKMAANDGPMEQRVIET